MSDRYHMLIVEVSSFGTMVYEMCFDEGSKIQCGIPLLVVVDLLYRSYSTRHSEPAGNLPSTTHWSEKTGNDVFEYIRVLFQSDGAVLIQLPGPAKQ